MSLIVAIAGGTGGVGRTIAATLITSGEFDVLILARKKDPEKEQEMGCRILDVDYSSVEALATVLDANNVHTVVSTLNGINLGNAELNLIAAADRAKNTLRFIPSNWGVKFHDGDEKHYPAAAAKLAAIDAIKSTSLQYSVWYTGFFSDYFAMPHIRTYMRPVPFIVDMSNGVASVPGLGNTPVVFTHTADIARFVAAALKEPQWELESYLVGDRLTLNQVVAIAEKVRGQKFKVTHDSLEVLQDGRMTDLPSHRVLYSSMPREDFQRVMTGVGILLESGTFDTKPPRVMNQDYPELKARTVEELMAEAWMGK